MTSEERFDKFENLLVQQGELIEKHQFAIRDLILVSRTTLTAVEEIRGSVQDLTGSLQDLTGTVQELTGSVQGLREAQGATDEKLNILIETIERIIRRLNGTG